MLNALGGALAAVFVHRTVAHITCSPRITLLVASGFAVSGAVWSLSTDAEFVTVPLAVSLIVLSQILVASPGRMQRRPFAFFIGLGTGVAILTYLTNATLIPIALVAFWVTGNWTWQTPLRQAGVFMIGVLLVTLLPAVWLVEYTRGDVWYWSLLGSDERLGKYGGVTCFDFAHGGYAFLRTLALFPNLGMHDRTSVYLAETTWSQRAIFAWYYAGVLTVAVVPLMFAISRRRELWRSHRRAITILAVWTLPYAAFAVYWVTGDISFWVPVLAAWWLLLGMVLTTFSSRSRAPSTESGVRKSCLNQQQAYTLTAAIVVLLLLVNGVGFILPHHAIERNQRYRIAMSIAERTTPEDLIITSAADHLQLYIRYFTGRRVVTVPPQAEFGDAAAVALANLPVTGGRVFLVRTNSERDASWQVRAAWTDGGETVWELLPESR